MEMSTRLHQSSSSYTLDQLDPTTLAISLIPLLPPPPKQDPSGLQSLTLPILAASLSTLPHSVVNAINFLAQELKLVKEQQLLSAGRSHKNSNPTNADNENDDKDRENREKWLENQKVNHLKKSISSLTNLQSTLQSRLLTTVDTLSDLQQTHKRDTQQLADERDGVRAVNQVLKRKIATLEKQLQESKEIMESVLERVQVVNKGDWSIVEHGVIQVFSPLPQPTNPPEQANAQDNSLLSEELCTFHQQCQGDSSPALRTESQDPLSKIPHFLLSSSTSSRTDGHGLNRSTTSNSNGRHNQRSLALIVELTEELEHLRQEVKVELKLKRDEINRLKGLIQFRDDELKQLMGRLEHFMGLDGFYVRTNPDEHPMTAQYPEELFNHSAVDLEATPRQKLDQRRKSGTNNVNSTHASFTRSDMRQDSPDSQSSEQRKLEEEIKQLEIQLREVTSGRQFPAPNDSTINPTFNFNSKSMPPENDRSSLISVNASDDHAISRVLADLSNQVAELKYTLKEVSRERDALKRLRSRNKKNVPSSNSSSSSQSDLDESSDLPENSRALKEALDRSKFECARLNRLLAQSESRILELERQIAEQESEFERVAERVQEKLKDQRSKMLQAQTQIDQLQNEVEQARLIEQTRRQELINERKRVESLLNLLDKKKKSKINHDDDDRIIQKQQNNKSKSNNKQQDSSSRSSVVSSSQASNSASSKLFTAESSKDPFN